MTWRDRAEARAAATRWNGPRPLAIVIRSSDITACPTSRMDAQHFRPDGTCMCLPPRDETLEPHIVKGDQ